ncbi:MAG: hypothetical protein RL720_529 [Actinomycetota bacterium]|jgi:hypothetical protein
MSNTTDNNELNAEVEIDDDALAFASGGKGGNGHIATADEQKIETNSTLIVHSSVFVPFDISF